MVKKYKVNTDNVDEEYKSLVKEEMTAGELSLLGTIILKNKIANFKQKLFRRKYEKKNDEAKAGKKVK